MTIRKFLKSVDDLHAVIDGFENETFFVGRMQSIRPGDPENEIAGDVVRFCQGFLEVPADWDSVGLSVEDLAGIATRFFAVDDREDFKFPGRADQSVGRFALGSAEVALAINDRGVGLEFVAIGIGG